MNCCCIHKFFPEENHQCTEKLIHIDEYAFSNTMGHTISEDKIQSMHNYIFLLIQDEKKYFNEEYIVTGYNLVALFSEKFSETEKNVITSFTKKVVYGDNLIFLKDGRIKKLTEYHDENFDFYLFN